MGYNFCNFLSSWNWFQFADSSPLVTSTEQDNQLLLNLFTKWCKWANLIVLVDKCKTFGVKKNGTLSTQLKLCLRVNNELIPQVKMGDNFIYLGRNFFLIWIMLMWKQSSLPIWINILISWIGYCYVWCTSYWLFWSIYIVNFR